MTDPNQRCTCGFRRFRERRIATESTVTRWLLFDTAGVQNGFGATPFGTLFGAGLAPGYAELTGAFRSTVQEIVCESCQRVRCRKALGGAALFGTYVEDGSFYIVVSDAQPPYTCFELRLTSSSGREYTSPFKYQAIVAPAITLPAEPVSASPTLPTGATAADTVLRARLPDVPDTESYLAELVDRCAGVVSPLTSITLEEAPMLILPSQADLSGFPRVAIGQSSAIPSQASSGILGAIPLEYCTGVLEYDARFGTLPDAQGWTHENAAGVGSPSDYTLVEGGVLRAGTPTGGNPSYWSNQLLQTASPVHGYGRFLVDSANVTPSNGEGLSFQGSYTVPSFVSPGWLVAYKGGEFYRVEADLSGEALVRPATEYDEQGWHEFYSHWDGTDGNIVFNGQTGRVPASYYGDFAISGVAELNAEFGDVIGNGVVSYIQNFVVSTPGRFLRPRFVGVAPVVAPRLRVYLIRDTSTGGSRVRLKLRYGDIAPYAVPATELSTTLSLPTANAVVEVSFQLAGLTSGQPFSFTLERDWTSADDDLEATAWMLQATLRSS
jgi:hypothetical protein